MPPPRRNCSRSTGSRQRERARRRLCGAHLRQPAAAEVRDGTRDLAPGFQSRSSKVSSVRWRRRPAKRSTRAAEREEAFSRQNDAQMAARLEAVPAPSCASRRAGGLSDGGTRSVARRRATTRVKTRCRVGSPALFASLPVLGVLLVWRWRRRRLRGVMQRWRIQIAKDDSGASGICVLRFAF